MIDLHMHSQESDGSLSPAALAAACAKAGVTAAALTDHDTLAGCRRFIAACAKVGVQGIAGVELSAEFAPGTMHILGYMPTTSIEPMQAVLSEVQASRAERNQQILTALDRQGYSLSQAEVEGFAGSGMTGRPHIAAAMVARGYVKDRREAFDRFLAKGRDAYCERYRLSPADCVQTIRAHGGAAVLAHPFTLRLSENKLSACVSELVSHGLSGIEVFYPEHSQLRRRIYQRLAKRFAVIQTGGSDFHGEANPAISIGRGFGNVFVSESVLEALQERVDLQVPQLDNLICDEVQGE